jgi:hypothetical protein
MARCVVLHTCVPVLVPAAGLRLAPEGGSRMPAAQGWCCGCAQCCKRHRKTEAARKSYEQTGGEADPGGDGANVAHRGGVCPMRALCTEAPDPFGQAA